MKRYVLRTALYIAGASLLALGIQFAILSRLGAGAYDALNANLHHFLTKYVSNRITLGATMAFTMAILYIITMVLKPRLRYLVGFLLALYISLMIDAFGRVLPGVQSLPFRGLYFLLSFLTIALGVAMIIKSKFPPTAMDNLVVILVQKTKRSVALIKVLLDLLYALMALLFGFLAGIGNGAVNFGTVLMAFFMGPLINFFLKILKK